MKQSSAIQLLLSIALGTAALVFLKWQDQDIESNSTQLIPLIVDSALVSRRSDSLPKPFAKMKAPVLLVPRPVPPVKRPARLRAEPGEEVPVAVTAYCLRGTTRSGTPVREGIVAADPRVFPLNSEIDLRIGDRPLGLFKVEDTGLLIKGRKIDLWLSDCAEARTFGRKRGIATISLKIRR
ncbi:MAG: 3D domain-containing protein [Phycisphaerae bacterium]|nr:3D domain-containing protein [Gemmatimonadaceae bacterium]